MNKLFTKIAALALGMTMATGVGVAVASSSKETSPAEAAEATAYTLSGTTTATGTAYNGENEVTQNSKTWKVNGNVNQSPWRIGGNKNNGLSSAGTVRHIQSQAAVSTENITKVVVTSAKPSSNAINPTNVSLKVGTAAGGSQTSSLSNGSWAASVTFNRPSGADWSSKYFEVDFTMPANTTTTNKFITLTSVVFYYDNTPAKTLSSISVSNDHRSFTVGDTFVKETVTAHYSDSTTATVTNSATFSGYNMSTAGNQTVSVSYSDTYGSASTTYSITVSAATTPTITLSGNSYSGYTGQSFSVTATYSNLTSAFAWSTSGSGTTTETITSTGTSTDGTSTYSGTLTGAGTKTLTATGGGVANPPTYTVSITQVTVDITKASTSIAQGKSETLAASHNASAVDGLTWESSDTSGKIAVDASGKVTVDSGATVGATATITATSKVDTSVSDSCTVTVTEAPDETTVDVSIASYASTHSWSNETKYDTINADSNITITADGGSNTGKYYTNGTNWRFYQNESGTLTVTANDGCTISSITVTYSVSNTGVLLASDGVTQVASNEEVTVNDSSYTFYVGNTTSATNGQVRVTAISVTYIVSGSVTYNVVNNVTYGSLDVSTITEGDDLSVTITPDTHKVLPTSLTSVTMGGVELVLGTGYTYNSSTGVVGVENVTGQIVISGLCPRDPSYKVLEAAFGTTTGGDSSSSTDVSSDVDNALKNNYHYLVDSEITFTAASKMYPSDGLTIKFGSSSSAGSISLSIPSTISGDSVYIKTVKVVAKNYNANTTTLSIGGTSQDLAASFDEYTVNLTGSSTSLTIESTSTEKRFYLQKISLTYDTSSVPTYSVTYNANEGTGSMIDPLSPYSAGATVTTLDNTFTRDGYTFTNWNTAANGSGQSYEEGEQFTINADVILYAQWHEGGGETTAKRCYTLVEDATGLVADAKYIIVGHTSTEPYDYYALSTTQHDNNRGQEDITVSGTVATVDSDAVQVVTLGGSTGAWTFGVSSGYLYAASSSKNYLRTQSQNDANGEWAITFGENGAATVTAQGANTHNLLQYNSSSGLFSAYLNAQQNIYLYRLDFEETLLANVTCNGSGSHEFPTGYTWNTDLQGVYNDLPSTEKSSLASKSAGVGSGLERYDYIVGKYNPQGLTDPTKTDYVHFITGRTVTPVGNGRILINSIIGENGNSVAIIVIISVISASAVGGYFFLRKRKEN